MIFKASKKIGVTAPASDFNKDGFLKGIEYLKNENFTPVYDNEILTKSENYLKGSDIYRKKSFEALLNNDDINTILMARGGYGSIRTLNLLDKQLLIKTKKMLVGFSDITTFHAFMSNNNIPSLHAPMVNAYNRDIESTKKLFSILNGKTINGYSIKPLRDEQFIEGLLVGGNLAVILSLVGTEYQLNIDNKILFVEDINEPLYKIDRMLMQLKLTKQTPKAIILGQFTNCGYIKDIEKLFLSIFSSTPIYSRLDIGHNNRTDSIMLGVRYQIKKEKLSLK